MYRQYSINSNVETEVLWRMLRDTSREVKLRLITLLSESIATAAPIVPIEKEMPNREFIEKFAGSWKGKESAETIIENIRANRTFRKPIEFD